MMLPLDPPAPAGALRLVVGEIPEHGMPLEGAISSDIFGLSDSEAQPLPPVRYRLFARIDDGLVVLAGSLECDFRLTCVRCLEAFPHRVEVPDFVAEYSVKIGEVLDLTERMREDILLALPAYPRCDASNLEARICPAAGRFDGASEGEGHPDNPEESSPSRSHVWDALDRLRPEDKS